MCTNKRQNSVESYTLIRLVKTSFVIIKCTHYILYKIVNSITSTQAMLTEGI